MQTRPIISGVGSDSLNLEVHLFGPFRVKVNGLTVKEDHWSRSKPKLIVKLLALQPHHQLHREQLMEMLWPELSPDAAARNLNKNIHLARRALEPKLKSGSDSAFIISQQHQVLLRAPGALWIDVSEFEKHAEEAIRSSEIENYERTLSLYEGDLLVEDLYEDWAAAKREQLRALYQDLLMRLARSYESLCDYQHSIERLKEIVALDSSNEEAHRGLMRLYAMTGNRPQSLSQFQQCRDALEKELDSEPDELTLELYKQIESGGIKPVTVDSSKHQPTQTIDSLAILPLMNASADPEMEYLSDGITESIINNLSQLTGLRVLAWSTVSRYKGRQANALEAGKALGVRGVLTGRVLQVSDRLVIKAELVDAADGSHLWGERYDRELEDIFAIEREISSEISEKLRLKLTGEEKARLTKRHTENIEAYHAYLKGRYFVNKRMTGWIRKGLQCFQQAIDIDPGYALAYAGLCDSYTFLVTWEALPPKEGFPKAKEAARIALDVDEKLAEAHAGLAHALLHNWEWLEAGKAFKRAIALNPGYASAYLWYSEYLAATGCLDEAITEIKKAQEIDPLSLITNDDLGWMLYFARRYDEAIKQSRKTIEMDPHFLLARLRIGQAYVQKAMYDEAIKEFQRVVAVSSSTDTALLLMGHAYAVSGRRNKALAVLDRLSRQAKPRYFSPYRVAAIHAGLGEKEEAFKWLEQAYEKHDTKMIWLKVDPVLDGLRSDERFENLLRRVGFTLLVDQGFL